MSFFSFPSFTDDGTEEEQAEARFPGSSSAQPSHPGPLKADGGGSRLRRDSVTGHATAGSQ